MIRRRSDLIRRLSLFDANVWLGEAEGFPLARAMPLAQLLEACRHYGLGGALLSHWDGKTVSPQEGNRVLAELFGGGAAERAGELGLQVAAVWTGVPVMAGEEGPLPGPGKAGRIQGPVGGGAPPSWLAGVRLFPRSHNFPLSPWLLESLVQWLLAHGLPLFVWHEETDWDSLHALTGAFPELPVVAETQARKILYHSRPLFALLEARPNLYVETSNLAGPDFVGHVVRNHGADRLIFGSFLPQNDPLAAIGMLLDAGISEAQMRTVAGGNLRRLLERRGQAGGPPEGGPG
jgi:hypothetical protein